MSNRILSQALNNEAHPQIVISVCTRGRPTMLRNLISSYQNLTIPEDVSTCLLIVENDTANFCEELVKEISAVSKARIHYLWERNIGIPFARNSCLQWALNHQHTHIAFVDDDEYFDKNWLQEIWSFYQSVPQNSAIQGRVIPVFPANTKRYLRGFYQPNARKTGDALDMCATNNVIVPLSFIKKTNIKFDISAPLEGGSDSIFFREAKSLGLSLIFCSNAIVYEEIPDSRASVSWISKRHFRIGIGAAKRNSTKSKFTKVKFVSTSIPILLFRLLKASMQLILIRKEKALKNWLKACNRAGQVFGTMGLHVKSYKKIDGY